MFNPESKKWFADNLLSLMTLVVAIAMSWATFSGRLDNFEGELSNTKMTLQSQHVVIQGLMKDVNDLQSLQDISDVRLEATARALDATLKTQEELTKSVNALNITLTRLQVQMENQEKKKG